MGKRKKLKKEEIAEDWCFICKDGGSLRVCDYKNWLKVYHPQCVGEDDSLMVNADQWFCNSHFCSVCRKSSSFRCLCCPSAVCKKCLYDAQFSVVKTNKGFCISCLELAWLIEMKKDVNSKGGKIDFNDAYTQEFFFKGYWQLTMRKERLTSEHVISAYKQLKKGELAADSYSSGEAEEEINDDGSLFKLSDYDDSTGTEEFTQMLRRSGKRNRSKGKMIAKNERHMDSPLLFQTSSDQPHSLHDFPLVLAETQDAVQDQYDGLLLLKSYPGIAFKAVPSSQLSASILDSELPKSKDAAPLSCPAVAVSESELPKAKEAAPSSCRAVAVCESAAPPSRPAIAVSESELPKAKEAAPSHPELAVSEPKRTATIIEIIDVKDETIEINPLDEGQALFADLEHMLDDSLKNFPGSSHSPPVTAEEINEAKHFFHQYCSMSFEQLVHHGLKDNFLSSLNLLLTLGYFPESMLSMVTSLQLNFLSNANLYSHCLEKVKRADEEKEHTESLRKEVANKRIHFDQILQCKQVATKELQELQKQLVEKRKLIAGLEKQAKGVVQSSRTSVEAFSQSIRSSMMLEKTKESSLQLMRDIDGSWNMFQLEVSRLS